MRLVCTARAWFGFGAGGRDIVVSIVSVKEDVSATAERSWGS